MWGLESLTWGYFPTHENGLRNFIETCVIYLLGMISDLPQSVKSEIEDKKKIQTAGYTDQKNWRQKNVGETMDKLDELGQPNEKKGREAVQKAYKEWQDEEFAKKSDRIEWLNKKAKFTIDHKIDYYHHVNTLVEYELSYLSLPLGYAVKSDVTPKGIKFVLKDRWGDIHIGGFTPSGLGLYDEQACRTSVNKIDDLITRLEQHPKNNLYLP